MRKIAIMVLLAGCFGLSACTPKLDAGGSEEQFYDSVEKVRLSLPQEQREQFTKSLSYLMGQQVLAGTASLQGSAPLTRNQVDKNVLQAVNGKTGQEIIEEAKIYGMK